jgi:hypothetical protein
VLVNAGGYFDPFLALVDHVIDEGFAGKECRDLCRPVADVADVLPALGAALPGAA